MKKIIFIAGSLREKSYNKMLAKAACNMALQHADIDARYIEILDYEMPIYNGDIEEKSGKFGLQRLSVLLANNAFGWRCDGPSVVGLFLECRKTA